MATYIYNFKDKHGNPVSDQDGINFAVDKLGESVLNEYHLYALYYGVNSAVTKRWTSAFHGIPANADVKGVFIPHFKNGYFVHADFSQNEYKVFAALAKEEAIVQAFREGKDIHRFIASKLYSKPEAEISGVERSVAKKLSFGLLYGKGIPAIAEEYFRGDVAYAQSLFDMFFTMFPRVKAYIEEQKAILFANREVYTVFGDAIKIEFDETKITSEKIDYEGLFKHFSTLDNKENYPELHRLYKDYLEGKKVEFSLLSMSSK